MTLQGCVEPCAHRARVGSRHHRGAHTEAGVVVDAREHRQQQAVGEAEADHVHLPELHGPGALPSAVLDPSTAPHDRLDQSVAHQGAIDAAASRRRLGAGFAQFEAQPCRTPAGMFAAQVHQPYLDCGGHLMRTGGRFAASIHQSAQAAGVVPR